MATDDSEAVRNKVAERLHSVKFLFIDEVSMVSCANFSQIEARIKGSQGAASTVPWAGMHVVAFGDFAQLKPIGGTSLADANAGNPSPGASRKREENAIKAANAASKKGRRRTEPNLAATDTINRIGRQLWMQFDTVILLEEKMRQVDDPTYGMLLERLRLGKATCCCCDKLPRKTVSRAARALQNLPAPPVCLRASPCDYHLLHSRVLDRHNPETQSTSWNTARIISHSNPVAAAWNRDATCQHAADTGHPILVSMAEDHVSTKIDRLTDYEKRRLLKLADSDTEARLSALPLTEGQEVIIRKNLSVDLGIVNGTEATIIKVVLDFRRQHSSTKGIQKLHCSGSICRNNAAYPI